MKPKRVESNQKASCRPTPKHWHKMNRKQRREMLRRIQSEDLSLEVVHPTLQGLISVTNRTMWLYLPHETAKQYGVSVAPRPN